MGLTRLLVIPRLRPPVRGIALSSPSLKWKLKWATGKDLLGNQLAIGIRQGHPQDPVFHTMDLDKPPGGDPIYDKIYYREHPKKRSYLDRLMHRLCASFFFFWISYQAYWHPLVFVGEWYLPYPAEFTDEELGIPPDDAPDPTPDQYWGNHGKSYKNYR